MYLDSAGHAASQRGDAGSSEQVVKEAQSPSLSPPPALLQGLGKSQTPGLKMAGALGPQEERGLKQKTIFTSSAANPCHRSYREKAMQLVPIIYLSTYIHIQMESLVLDEPPTPQPKSLPLGVSVIQHLPLPDVLRTCRGQTEPSVFLYRIHQAWELYKCALPRVSDAVYLRTSSHRSSEMN